MTTRPFSPPTTTAAGEPTGLSSFQEALPAEQNKLSELLTLCWRRRYTVAVVGLGVAICVFLYFLSTTPLYEAHASLEVFAGSQPVSFSGGVDRDTHIDVSLINTQRDRLLSTPVLSRTLETSRLGEGPAYLGSSNPIDGLRNRLKVNIKRDSYVFDVTLTDEDPERARRGLEALLAAYFARLEERASSWTSTAVSFLQHQVDDARSSRDQARTEEQEFRRLHGILSDNPDDNPHTTRLFELNREHVTLERELSASESLVVQIKEAGQIEDEQARMDAYMRINAIGSNPVVDLQLHQLNEAEAESKRLATRYQYKHPRMKEAERQISERKTQLADSVEMAKAAIISSNQEREQQVTDLDRLISSEKEAVVSYRSDLVSLHSLSEVTSTRERLLSDLTRRLGEQRVVNELDSKLVVVNSQPESTPGPVNVSTTRSVLTSIILGLLAGVVAAAGREQFDRRIYGHGQARTATGLPLLVQIPHLRSLKQGATITAERVSTDLPALTEAYRTLRATLNLAAPLEKNARCLMVVSPSAGEGKSTVVQRLAMSLASSGSRVLVVDADMRNPSLGRMFAHSEGPGLSQLLAGSGDVAPRRSEFPNLEYLPAGEMPANPTEMLYSPALAAFLTKTRSEYDYIIVDSPPVTMVTDALVIGELVDKVILVLRDRFTLDSLMRESINRLAPLRPKMIGFILNAARDIVGSDLYYYSNQGFDRQSLKRAVDWVSTRVVRKGPPRQ